MNHNENQFQTFGICQKLFYFIEKIISAQALKTVTLGPPISREPTRSSKLMMTRYSECGGSIKGLEDSESDASIDTKDDVSPLLEDDGKVKVEMVTGTFRPKAPRKVVSIKDEPEIIGTGNKRRKTMADRQAELRPLKSILKVGSSSHLTNSKLRDMHHGWYGHYRAKPSPSFDPFEQEGLVARLQPM